MRLPELLYMRGARRDWDFRIFEGLRLASCTIDILAPATATWREC
jgi:hypothetical protein